MYICISSACYTPNEPGKCQRGLLRAAIWPVMDNEAQHDTQDVCKHNRNPRPPISAYGPMSSIRSFKLQKAPRVFVSTRDRNN